MVRDIQNAIAQLKRLRFANASVALVGLVTQLRPDEMLMVYRGSVLPLHLQKRFQECRLPALRQLMNAIATQGTVRRLSVVNSKGLLPESSFADAGRMTLFTCSVAMPTGYQSQILVMSRLMMRSGKLSLNTRGFL